MNTELFKQYASIKKQLSDLIEQETLKKEAILQELNKDKIDKAEFAFGKFSVATRSTYTYTDKIAVLEEKVKLAKFKEQEKGIAKTKETKYLVFKNK